MDGVTQTVSTRQIRSTGCIEDRSVMPELTEGMDPELVAAIFTYLQTGK